jgi:hypothetical protein
MGNETVDFWLQHAVLLGGMTRVNGKEGK